MGLLPAQMYRVFFTDKGEVTTSDHSLLPVFSTYLETVRFETDSIWMTSAWLNYALVQSPEYPASLLKYKFIDRIEKVIPMQSNALQENENKKDSLDPKIADAHRQWQLDTMGYGYFKDKQIEGNGVVVAIIDAGFNLANESKAFKDIYSSGRVLRTWDFIDNDSNVYHGSNHGTAVWSCIAGNMDGKQIGLATGASFILLRSEDQKTETMADEDRWIQAIEKAYEWGADIVNSSIGFTNVLHSLDQVNGGTLISKAAQIATDKGMLVVVSAGNEWLTFWKTLSIPADAEGVIAVGGIDRQGNHSYFSSVGPTADGRIKPDVVAPGTCVIAKGNELTMGSGTSYAAPMVTGYLACMLQLKGKDNFNRDSIIFYSGLHPYYDYVFGYGIPQCIDHVLPKTAGWYAPDNNYFQIDRTNFLLRTQTPSVDMRIFLKIEGADGILKFSKVIHIPASGKYKPAISKRKIPFTYGKYVDPSPNDKWYIWFNGMMYVY